MEEENRGKFGLLWRKRSTLEKCLILSIILFLLCFAIAFITVIIQSESHCKTPTCINVSERFHAILNKSVDPCDNFYDFICGKAIRKHSQDDLRRLEWRRKKIVAEPASKNDTNSLVLAKQLYKACTDLEAIEKDEDRTILSMIEKLGGWPLLKGDSWNEYGFSWMGITIQAKKVGLKYDWILGIEYGLNDDKCIIPHIIYPKDLSEIASDLEYHYFNLMRETAEQFGVLSIRTAAEEIKDILNFEKQLTQITQIKDEQRTNVTTVADLQEKWPQINWYQFLSNISESGKVIQGHKMVSHNFGDSFGQFLDLLSRTPRRVLANYFIWKELYWLSPVLSDKALRDKFELFNLIQKRKSQKRNDLCMDFTLKNLGYVVDAELIRKYIDEDLMKQAEVLVDFMKTVTVKMIAENTFIHEERKHKQKLIIESMQGVIGGPKWLLDPSEFDKRVKLDKFHFGSANIVAMITQLQQFHSDLSLVYTEGSALIKNNERWVSEFQSNSLDNIIITYDVLQERFVKNAPNYLNIACLGQVIIQQLADAFETLSDYKEVVLSYNRTMSCLFHEYPELSNETDSVDETLTYFMELEMLYRYYQEKINSDDKDLILPGLSYTPNQLFWIQALSTKCNSTKKSQIFINGAVRNSQFFADDFNCPINSPMNPEKKCGFI